MDKNKFIIAVGVLVVIGISIIGFYLFSSNKSIPKQSTSEWFEGRITCAPHKDTTGPITLECLIAFLDTENNKYYLLKTPNNKFLNTGNEKIRIFGTLTTHSDPKYNIDGTITITKAEYVDSAKEVLF